MEIRKNPNAGFQGKAGHSDDKPTVKPALGALNPIGSFRQDWQATDPQGTPLGTLRIHAGFAPGSGKVTVHDQTGVELAQARYQPSARMIKVEQSGIPVAELRAPSTPGDRLEIVSLTAAFPRWTLEGLAELLRDIPNTPLPGPDPMVPLLTGL